MLLERAALRVFQGSEEMDMGQTAHFLGHLELTLIGWRRFIFGSLLDDSLERTAYENTECRVR